MNTFTQSGNVVPQSFVTKGKQRLKQHNNIVYLNNGDEFEIELFNPTQKKVLAKININGNIIGSGIILRPGERVFLERYLDVAKKFKFETYMVDGDDNQVKKSIANNGEIFVTFHNEMVYTYAPTNLNLNYSNGNNFVYNTWGTYFSGDVSYTTNTCGNLNPTKSRSATTNVGSLKLSKNTEKTLDLVETGRVEKGSNSNQKFVYDNSQFDYGAIVEYVWKIKPSSTKPITSEDLIMYCSECGAKRKKDTFKFCPHCGTKF